MTNQDNRPMDAADLRQKAEALARERTARTPEGSAALSPEEIRKTLHELRVHQIELEMQNEELRTAQAEIEAGRARYFDLYDLAPVGYCTVSEKGLILEANLTTATLLGTARGALVKQPISRFIFKEDQDIYYLHRKKLFETGEPQKCDLRLVKPDGALFWAHLKATAAQAEDGAPFCRVVISDISGRKQAEGALNRRNIYLEALNETTLGLMQRMDQKDLFQIIVGRAAQLAGADECWLCVSDPEGGDMEFKAVAGPNVSMIGSRFESGRGIIGEILRTGETVLIDDYHVWPMRAGLSGYSSRRATIGIPLRYENRLAGILGLAYHDPARRFDDDIVDILKRLAHLASVAIDNTRLYERVKLDLVERERAEKEREKLQVQLSQVQRMESIGRLTGGIAHDFNNLLTTIIGNADLLRDEMDKDSPHHGYIADIRDAGERSARLVRQLLAFSCKQVLQPEPVDMNEIVLEMKSMLRRMMGEDIQIDFIPGNDLGKVMADVGQIEQVIMNLAVNARDAMPTGGKFTIETSNVELDEAYAETHVAVTPGSYVMTAASDTGSGIPDDIMDKIFEPFFTTKEKGKGTGLGLPTVYGIVKQSGGNIWVYSEPGKGTCFKIYLPRLEKEKKKPERRISPEGSETILVVEDEEQIRTITDRILSGYGYRVLTAASGQEALDIAQGHDGPIHLLLTDVVMPGLSGRELAEKLTGLMPDMKVIFMSGYTDNAIAHHGILDAGVNFIQKPFTPDILGGKVREVLG